MTGWREAKSIHQIRYQFVWTRLIGTSNPIDQFENSIPLIELLERKNCQFVLQG